MQVKIKTRDVIKDIIKKAERLNGKAVEVGAFDGEHAWLAHIHEYGCNISAKKAQYLTVPINPKAKGKKAADFPDIFFVQSKQGEKFLAIPKGKDEMELLFWLTKSVKIPERSFLRAGHDQYIDEVAKRTEKALQSWADGKITDDELLDLIGQQLSSKIKTFARNLNSPPNGGATTETKGSSNPLVDTGQMIESITWRVK